MTFPPPYGGAFDTIRAAGADPEIAHRRFSQEARTILARRCDPDVASRLVGIIERMAAAAGSVDET